MGENLLMKIKVKRSELQSNDDIWNAILSVYGEYDFPTKDEKLNDFSFCLIIIVRLKVEDMNACSIGFQKI